MHGYKSIYSCFLGFALNGQEQMDPWEVFKLWVRDLLPELQVFFLIVLRQNSMFIYQLFPYNVCVLSNAMMLCFINISMYVLNICQINLCYLALCELCHNTNRADRSAPFIDLTLGFNNIQDAVADYFAEENIMEYDCQV